MLLPIIRPGKLYFRDVSPPRRGRAPPSPVPITSDVWCSPDEGVAVRFDSPALVTLGQHLDDRALPRGAPRGSPSPSAINDNVFWYIPRGWNSSSTRSR